jgi:hypothetical protein
MDGEIVTAKALAEAAAADVEAAKLVEGVAEVAPPPPPTPPLPSHALLLEFSSVTAAIGAKATLEAAKNEAAVSSVSFTVEHSLSAEEIAELISASEAASQAAEAAAQAEAAEPNASSAAEGAANDEGGSAEAEEGTPVSGGVESLRVEGLAGALGAMAVAAEGVAEGEGNGAQP